MWLTVVAAAAADDVTTKSTTIAASLELRVRSTESFGGRQTQTPLTLAAAVSAGAFCTASSLASRRAQLLCYAMLSLCSSPNPVAPVPIAITSSSSTQSYSIFLPVLVPPSSRNQTGAFITRTALSREEGGFFSGSLSPFFFVSHESWHPGTFHL